MRKGVARFTGQTLALRKLQSLFIYNLFNKSQADTLINPDDVPGYVVPNTEKLELGKLKTDIQKFYKSRLFLEQHKMEWNTLLSDENTRWIPKNKAATWPLQNIIANKARLREKQKGPESDGNGLGFLGQKPEGVPADVDDMVRSQVAPVREVRF